MVVKTRHPVSRKKLQQGTVTTTANGLPVDSILEIQATNRLIDNTTTALSYSDPTVTANPSVDLSVLKNFKPKYTGVLVLQDSTNEIYYIDRLSIDSSLNTFDVYLDPSFTGSPSTINLVKGWNISEAKLVNKMAVSTAAHIDEVHFNGFDINLQLNGTTDTIAVVNPDTGTPLNINPDGSIDANCNIDAEDGDTIAISRHLNTFKNLQSVSKLKAQLNTTTFTSIFTYTALQAGLRIRTIKNVTDTFGTFRVKVDGTVEDITRTSTDERNSIAEFIEDLDLPMGKVLEVEFRPDRNRLTSYEFFLRMEGYYQL